MKTGIMGGTFDPIHNGHLMLAREAYRRFALDEVWFMPNGHPPHKDQDSIGSDVADRVEMVRLAIETEASFHLEPYEANCKEVSYSYQTLSYLHQKYKDDDFYFIIGADSLFAIETWMHPELIFPQCTILAAYRDEIDTNEEMYEQINYLRGKYQAVIELLATPLLDISSSSLRRDIKSGISIERQVPPPVNEYIKKHNLYV